MHVQLSRLVTASILVATAFQANAATATYTFTTLGSLGGNGSAPAAINNVGQVAGYSRRADGTTQWHATRWNGTTATDLGKAGEWESFASGINDAGQVVGESSTHRATLWNGTIATDLGATSGRTWSRAMAINNAGQVAGVSSLSQYSASRATRWDGTQAIDLGTLGGTASIATAINNVGQVAGYSDTSTPYVTHATLWNGTQATDLGTLGGTYSAAMGINDTAQIVGYSTTSNGRYRATLWNGTQATDLGSLGGDSFAQAINNVGQVVGRYSNGSDNPVGLHPFIWENGTMTDLNSFLDASTVNAGWVLIDAVDISDNGWIVGGAYNTISGKGSAYLLSVVAIPEPETYAMMLAGLGLIGLKIHRRRKEGIA